ncbi:uncharacterized protein LOC123214344 [Mangifera indica]|uniref:uncharacterized protein LOC123214344 n=1 Tax=Mangifera indica TaxID=29780 RepID=UPI001CFA3BB9|nr:uncharacterized protein LOC123214344 [Mangifera indica]
MSMSSQPQQPAVGGVVYPNAVTRPPPNSPASPSSDGSFGTVFIILAVIVVISAVACCLGRLCNRRHPKHKPHKQSHNSHPQEGQVGNIQFHKQQSHGFRPRERERDIEFGFDKNIAASKPAGNGQTRGFKQFGNGDIKFEPKLGGV